jgi:hypothetical protein
MARGKYYSLEEALKKNDLKGFAREHPSTGDKKQFDELFNRMSKNLPVNDQTSKKD